MTKNVLLATDKAFAKVAVDGISDIFSKAGYNLIKLENYTDKKDLLNAIKDAHAVIIRSDKITAEVLDAAPNLQIVVRAGAGYDNVDLAKATANNVCVMNTPGQNSNAVAELAFGLMLFLARKKFTQGDGTELRGKTVGIHAYGNVGRFVAMIAKGFGMNVAAYDPYVETAKMETEGIKVYTKIEDLYANCEYISIHIPANEQTKKSINYALLSKLMPGACVVNTARKEVIDEEGLVAIMNERKDIMYGSDVAPDCHAEMVEKFGFRYHSTTKKMGAQTSEANVNAGLAAANQIVRFFENNDRSFQVNK